MHLAADILLGTHTDPSCDYYFILFYSFIYLIMDFIFSHSDRHYVQQQQQFQKYEIFYVQK